MDSIKLKVGARSERFGVILSLEMEEPCHGSKSERDQAVFMLQKAKPRQPILFSGREKVMLDAYLEVTGADSRALGNKEIVARCTESKHGCEINDNLALAHGSNLQEAIIDYLKQCIYETKPESFEGRP